MPFSKAHSKNHYWSCLFCSSQSQKTQGFCVADFSTLSDERRSRSKIFPLFIWIKEPWVRKFEGLERSKLLGISQTTVFKAFNLVPEFIVMSPKASVTPAIRFCDYKCNLWTIQRDFKLVHLWSIIPHTYRFIFNKIPVRYCRTWNGNFDLSIGCTLMAYSFGTFSFQQAVFCFW